MKKCAIGISLMIFVTCSSAHAMDRLTTAPTENAETQTPTKHAAVTESTQTYAVGMPAHVLQAFTPQDAQKIANLRHIIDQQATITSCLATFVTSYVLIPRYLPSSLKDKKIRAVIEYGAPFLASSTAAWLVNKCLSQALLSETSVDTGDTVMEYIAVAPVERPNTIISWARPRRTAYIPVNMPDTP